MFEIYQIKAWIRKISPVIYRRILIPDTFSLADLHHTLQTLFSIFLFSYFFHVTSSSDKLQRTRLYCTAILQEKMYCEIFSMPFSSSRNMSITNVLKVLESKMAICNSKFFQTCLNRRLLIDTKAVMKCHSVLNAIISLLHFSRRCTSAIRSELMYQESILSMGT